MSLRKFRAAIRFTMCASIISAFVILFSGTSFGDPSTETVEAAKLLPQDLGSFHQTMPVKIIGERAFVGTKSIDYSFSPPYEAITQYASADDEKFSVQWDRFENDSAAYSLFTFLRKNGQGTSLTQTIGTVSTVTRDAGLIFFKGANVILIG
jgi:hypothetical protein